MKTIIILGLCLGSLLGYDVYTTKDEIALRRAYIQLSPQCKKDINKFDLCKAEAYSFDDLEKCNKGIDEKCINQFDDLLIKELNAIK